MQNQSNQIRSNPKEAQPKTQLVPLLVGAFVVFVALGFHGSQAKPSGSDTTGAVAAATPTPIFLDKLNCAKTYPVTFTVTELRTVNPDENGDPKPTLNTTPTNLTGSITCFGDISIAAPSPSPTKTKDVTKTIRFSDLSGTIDPSKGVMSLKWVYNVNLSGSYKATPVSSATKIPCEDSNDPNKCCHIGPGIWNTASNTAGTSDFVGKKYDQNTGTAKLVDATWGLDEIPTSNNFNQCGATVAEDLNGQLPQCRDDDVGQCAVSVALTLSPIVKGVPVSRDYQEKETTSGSNNSATSPEVISFLPRTISGNTSTTDPDNFSFDLPVGKTLTVAYVAFQSMTIEIDCKGNPLPPDPDDPSGPLLTINGKTYSKSFSSSNFNNCEDAEGTKGTVKTTTYRTTYSVSNNTTSSTRVVISLAVVQAPGSLTSGFYKLDVK